MDLASTFNIISLLRRCIFILIFTILLLTPLLCWTYLFDQSIFLFAQSQQQIFRKNVQVKVEIPLNCSNNQESRRKICPNNYPIRFKPKILTSPTCPDYFQWIHEDLKPWKEKGICREVFEREKTLAHFRLVIINNSVYFERLNNNKCFQTREEFTIWGILQLLRLYPGMVPDLELLFFCNDKTVILKRDYQGVNSTSSPSPLFHYCADDQSLDILFPDWTFWGWSETNIRPWGEILRAIKRSNKRTSWVDRVPYAFWKGNSHVAPIREQLMKCNVSKARDWNARLYHLSWVKEHKMKFKDTRLEDQCTHRYKIYIEGRSWSVSRKYILACSSMTLAVKPKFYDFFSRSLKPMKHYWPIRPTHICQDIKSAVDWGNNNTKEAQAIGNAGSKFVQENIKMEYVYDYMFHLLKEYSKLLKFKPRIPQGAKVEKLCYEMIACNMKHVISYKFMVESMVKSPRDKLPCHFPALEALGNTKVNRVD